MLGVVSDGSVGGGGISPSLIVHRDSRQVAVGPGVAAVGGGGEANVGAAPDRIARHLKCADDGRAPRVGVRLNLGSMLAALVGEVVLAHFQQNGLRACRLR